MIKLIKYLFYLLIFVFFIVSLYAGYIYSSDVSKLKFYSPPLSTQVFDVNGKVIANIYDKEHRLYIKFSDIPPRLIEALVAIEDTSFFEHYGVNFEAIFRAAYKVIRARKAVEGASTLTQQLVKNVLLTRKKTISRKFKEIILSLKIETMLSKEEILERYLNEIYFGHGYYGLLAASRGYFHKEPFELSLKEMAILVGLPRAPSFYDPTKHLKMALSRANIVLDRMKHLGWINHKEYTKATKEIPVIFDESISLNQAPYVIDEITRNLRYEYPDIKTAGYKIYTTIDLDIQKIADEALRYGYEKTLKRLKKIKLQTIKEEIVLEDGNITVVEKNVTTPPDISKFNGAIVVLRQKSGEVLALSGGIDFYKSPFNRATRAKRQVGSSMKPFIYLCAFDFGYSPASIVYDISRTYRYKLKNQEKIWRPQNYEKNFLGILSAREAVVHSRNLATINLVEDIGLDIVREKLKNYGFKNLPNDLSLALGSLALSPYEMSKYLSIISNYGTRTTPFIIKKIKNKNGVVLSENKVQKTKVTSPSQAFLMIDVLKDVVKKGTGRKARTKGRELAGKTGTTNDNKDAWFCGFSPSIQTVVWFGNDDNTQIAKKETGGKISAPVLGYFYKKLLKIHPEIKRHFDQPKGVYRLKINGKNEIFTDISKPPKNEEILKPASEELIF